MREQTGADLHIFGADSAKKGAVFLSCCINVGRRSPQKEKSFYKISVRARAIFYFVGTTMILILQ